MAASWLAFALLLLTPCHGDYEITVRLYGDLNCAGGVVATETLRAGTCLFNRTGRGDSQLLDGHTCANAVLSNFEAAGCSAGKSSAVAQQHLFDSCFFGVVESCADEPGPPRREERELPPVAARRHPAPPRGPGRS